MNEERYKVYLKDQQNDGILPEQYHQMSKGWAYGYSEFLTNLLKDKDFSSLKILDIGCREFFTYDFFLEKYSNKISGIDVGKDALKYCEVQKKPLVEMDAHAMSFDKESFDIVMAVHSFEHMYDMPKVLQNCNTILKTGGYLYVIVPMPSHNEGHGHWWDIPSDEYLNNELEKASFTKIHLQCYNQGFCRPERETIALYRKV